ncbi:MAG TPA: hypothetical protein VMM92_14335 [Thermoanaerobaculia bacterium]|nr:hypothetical protein [Thermoanaerobaculia bacterium]
MKTALLLVVACSLMTVHSARAETKTPETAALATLRAAIFAPASDDQAPLGAQWVAACTVTLRCPNGQLLTCASTPCRRLDNCQIVCQGVIETCSGTCTIQ